MRRYIEASGEYRLVPARWLQQWRAFATSGGGRRGGGGGGSGFFGGSGGEEAVEVPTREALAEAAASLRCHHGRAVHQDPF